MRKASPGGGPRGGALLALAALAALGLSACADEEPPVLVAPPDCEDGEDPSSVARCEGAPMPEWELENIQEDHPRFGETYGLYDADFEDKVVFFALFEGW